MTHEDDIELSRSVRESLDHSIERLDAATLAKLNQTRHNALAVKQRHGSSLPWLTASSLAAIAVAILASRLLLTSPDTLTEDLPLASINDAEFIVVSEDVELLENLDFVTWMLMQENAG